MGIEFATQGPDLQPAAAKPEHFRAAFVLSAIVVVLAGAISVIGLGFPSVYGGDWGNGMGLGNDLVTLAVAVPVLALAILYSAHGSVRARVIWLGALYYMLYNYAFYVFGLPVTRQYVPIVAAFAISGLALALGMHNLDIEAVGRRFGPRTPGRWIAAFLAYVAVMISILWISQWVKYLMTGRVPDVNGSASAYQVIAAVDLSFMVPVQIAAAITLWRRRPWGYVLGGMTLVQGAIYTAVMATVCVFGWVLNPGTQLLSNWFIGCLFGTALCALFLACLMLGVEPAPAKDSGNRATLKPAA